MLGCGEHSWRSVWRQKGVEACLGVCAYFLPSCWRLLASFGVSAKPSCVCFVLQDAFILFLSVE